MITRIARKGALVLATSLLVVSTSAKADTSNKAWTELHKAAACYANLLDVKNFNVVIKPGIRQLSTGEHVMGSADHDGTIALYVYQVESWNEMIHTLAHEMRHLWQFENNKISLFGEVVSRFQSWENRSFEIDAEEWADKHWHKCQFHLLNPAYKKPPARKAMSQCRQWHKVAKGDTWYALRKRYSKSPSWLNSRTRKPLRLGTSVCVSGGSQ